MDEIKGSTFRRRVVVVGGPNRLAEEIRAESESLEVVEAGNFLDGISLAAEPETLAVLANIEGGPRRLDAAVGGLRSAADPGVPVVLCCPPHAEPIARRLVGKSGTPQAPCADDYLIFPPTTKELNAALRLSRDADRAPSAKPSGPERAGALDNALLASAQFEWAASEELAQLSDVLAHLHGGLGDLLNRLAGMLEMILPTDGVEIVAYDQTVRRGMPVDVEPLVEPLVADGRRIGQVTVLANGSGDDQARGARIRQYARLCSEMLAAHHREADARCQALTDPVSGLYNRRYLDQLLPRLFERATQNQNQDRNQNQNLNRSRVTLLLFEVDDIEHCAGYYGQRGADEVIQEIGQLMKRCCRGYDTVVRFGGDEFVVVFWDAEEPRVAGSQHPTDPLLFVDRFRDALSNHQFKNLGPDVRGNLTFSGGVATFPGPANSPEELLRRADEVLIQTKRQGINRVLPIGAEWLAADLRRLGVPTSPTRDPRGFPDNTGLPTEEA